MPKIKMPRITSRKPMFILFLCAGNTCRSPMAAAITKHQLGEGYICESAGVFKNLEPNVTPAAIALLEKLQCGTIFDSKTREVSRELIEKADLIFCVNNKSFGQMKKEFPEYEGKFVRYAPDLEGVPDPYDLEHFPAELQKKYEKRSPAAYEFVIRQMLEIYTPQAIQTIKNIES
jgi:protein-tyrosine phosphatase